MKKTIAILLALLMLAAFAACGKNTPATTDPETTAPAETEAPTEAEDTTEAEPETVARPTADGQAVEAYDLSFYLPSDITANEYNGMLGVYEFYTGDHSGSRPTGMDISISVTAESNAKGDLNTYARETGAQRNHMAAEPATESINGFDWLVFREDGKINYFAIFNEGLYEIYAERGGESDDAFNTAVAMLEQTLFLAVNE